MSFPTIKNTKPLISIIIPSYNRANLLIRSINSALNQTYKNFELIVVDDGSTDNTKKLLEPYINAKKIKYFYQKNRGPSSAKNMGMKSAKGDYLAFLDSDDEWLPKKLEKQLELFERSTNPNLGFVGCNSLIINEKNNKKQIYKTPRKKNAFYALLVNNFIWSCSSIMIKGSIIDQIGFFDENLSIGEDWDMWIRITQKYDFDFVDEPLFKYYVHNANITNAITIRKKEKYLQYISDKYIKYFENNPKLYSRRLRYDGTRYVLSGNLKKARENFVHSIRLNPLNYRCYFYFLCSLTGTRIYGYLANVKMRLKSYKFFNKK